MSAALSLPANAGTMLLGAEEIGEADDLRAIPATPEEEEGFRESVREHGILQPIMVRAPEEGEAASTPWLIVFGRRRLRAARALGLTTVPAQVFHGTRAEALAAQVAENMARHDFHVLDQWAAMAALMKLGLTVEEAGARIGRLPREAKRLARLSEIYPPILHAMREHGMPNLESELRDIANAPIEVQRAAWEKTKGHVQSSRYGWHYVRNACIQRRFLKADARFDDAMAREYGITWEEDLFAQPGDEQAIYTTDGRSFEMAQKAWVERVRIPELAGRKISARWIGGAAKSHDPKLPKGAERVHGDEDKAPKTVIRGYYLNPYSGQVQCALFKLPSAKKDEAPAKGKGASAPNMASAEAEHQDEGAPAEAPSSPRPPITRAGIAEIHARQTSRIREDLRERAALRRDLPDARTLLACMLLLLDADNVQIAAGDTGGFEDIAARLLLPNGVLDMELVRSVELERLALLALARGLISRPEGEYHRGSGDALGRIACAIGVTFPRCDDAEFLARHVSKAELLRLGAGLHPKLPGKTADLAKLLAGRLHDRGWHPAAWDRRGPAEVLEEDEDLVALGPAATDQPAAARPASRPAPATPEEIAEQRRQDASAFDLPPTGGFDCSWDGTTPCREEGSTRCAKLCPRHLRYAEWCGTPAGKAAKRRAQNAEARANLRASRGRRVRADA